MSKIFYNTTPADNVTQLLSHFKGSALRSPTRSTVPLLDMTLNAPARLAAITHTCGAEPESDLHFEYEATSGSASARPSQTDLMVLGKSSAVAIEAKWTEPQYENVAQRLLRRTTTRHDDDSAEARALDRAHQEAEVGAWLSKLQPMAQQPLTTRNMAGVVYQMIHRAASAVGTELSPTLVYLHFHDPEARSGSDTADYRTALMQLYERLGQPQGLRMYAVTQPIGRTDNFRTIAGLSKTDPSTAAAICAALQSGPLFDYGTPDIAQVA